MSNRRKKAEVISDEKTLFQAEKTMNGSNELGLTFEKYIFKKVCV